MPQEQVTALLGALSNLCTLPEHRILSKKISTSKSQPGSPEWPRAASYKWENGHKRKAAGAGRAACPAGISHATGTGPSQDHIPWGLELSGTGKVQVQGALAAWLCQHPSPQHSPASAVPPTGESSCTPCHLSCGITPQPVTSTCSERQPQGPAKPHTTMTTPTPPAWLWDQPAPLWGHQPAHAAHRASHSSHPEGCGGARYSWGQAGHLGSNNEGVLEHRDEQGSALQHSQTLGIGDNCPAPGCRFAQEKTKP